MKKIKLNLQVVENIEKHVKKFKSNMKTDQNNLKQLKPNLTNLEKAKNIFLLKIGNGSSPIHSTLPLPWLKNISSANILKRNKMNENT